MLAQGWSGEIAMAQAQNPDVAFVIPAEGAFVFVDNWTIPKGTRQKELAEDFINFVLRPEISAMIVNHARYASVNEAATALVKPEILKGRHITGRRDEAVVAERLQRCRPAVRTCLAGAEGAVGLRFVGRPAHIRINQNEKGVAKPLNVNGMAGAKGHMRASPMSGHPVVAF